MVTDGPAIAEALRTHWEPTFTRRTINAHCLEQWLAEDATAPNGLRGAVQPLLRTHSAWHVRCRDVRRAIEMSSASAPGPDGIPYAAWRRLGPFAVDVLHQALQALSCEGGMEALLQAFPLDAEGNTEFNQAILAFIPKKLPQRQGELEYFLPADVRPLSIVNTDNRLLASAVRLRVEPLLAEAVSRDQRGLLPDVPCG